MYPNFICVGAQKAGTSTLHDILRNHPEIYLPELKEAHFFDDKERYIKGIDWWLCNFFKEYKGEKIMGVMTPEYLYYDDVPMKIVKSLGEEVKIIILLRNPVERAYSHYLMSKRRGFECLDFLKAIEIEDDRIRINDFNKNHFSYINRGKYYQQVRRYYEQFGEKNILLLSFEKDLIMQVGQTICRIQKFLGVDIIELNTDMQSNRASAARFKFINNVVWGSSPLNKMIKPFVPSLTARIKIKRTLDKLNQVKNKECGLEKTIKNKIMNDYFLKDIIKLEKYIGADYSYWKDAYKI